MKIHPAQDTVTVSNLEMNIHSAQDTLSVSNRELFRNNVTQEWLKSGVTQVYIDFLFEHYQFDSTGLFICDAQEARQLLQMDYPLDHQEYYWGFKDINGNIQIKVNIPNGAKYLCPRNNGSDAFRLPIPDYFEQLSSAVPN